MKNILSLCINLLLLIISDAVPLKLIAGDRSVVKKDGATHTISKYYVVPNDYDTNNATNTTAANQKTTLLKHSLNSKNVNSGSIDEEKSESKAKTVNYQSDSDATVAKLNTQINFRSDLNVGQEQLTNQHDDSTESTVSMSAEQTWDSDDLGNLQVKPILIPINISRRDTGDEIVIDGNLGNSLQNESALSVENATNTQNELEELILSEFGIKVHETYSRSLNSFWKLIKLNMDTKSDDDEMLTAIEKLLMLLNIFTTLYEAAQLQQPVDKMIDGIFEILQIPFVEKSNKDESQVETNVSGDYDEECLRKCDRRRSKPQLDSNGTYLSETEGSQENDSIDLENMQRRQRGNTDDNDLIKMSDDPDSKQVTVSNEPTNVLQSQTSIPYDLNVGVPDGHNVLSSDIQKDSNLIQMISDSTGNLDDQPVTVDSRFPHFLPMTMGSRASDNLPFTIEDKTTEYFPWPQTTPTNGLPWHIEDKTSANNPFTIEHVTTNKGPWNIKSRTDPIWTIENKNGLSPITTTTTYKSSKPSATHGGNILFNPNQSVQKIVNNLNKGVKKPYHIYTYVINPTATIQGVPSTGNNVQMISKQPNDNLEATLSGLPTLHSGKKVVYKNQPSQSHYVAKYSLPTTGISSVPSFSQVKHTNYVTKTSSHKVNPLTLYSQIPQEDSEPQYLGVHGSESNHKSTLLQLNTHPSEPKSSSGEEIDSYPGNLHMNIPPLNPFESLSSLGNIVSSSSTVDTSSGIPDQLVKPNLYNPNDNGNLIQQSSQQALINHASAHSSVQTNQYPGFISSSASSSTYTNGPDEPLKGGQIYQQPGAISAASADSEFTNVNNYYDAPVYPGVISPTYEEDINDHRGFISKATAHSEYTNVPDDNTNLEPNNGQEPGLIYKLNDQSPVYPNVVDDSDYSIPVNAQIQNQPGYISKASSVSQLTIPNNYNVPTHDYVDNTDIYPGKIQEVSDYPAYTDEVNHYITVKPENDEPMHNANNYLVPYQPYGHTVKVINQPNLINYIPENQNLKPKLAPTYRLFTIQNLQNLENAIIKTIQMHEPAVHDDRALINLKNIISVILTLAENLDATDGTNAWYEKIFYNSQLGQHPLQPYIYNLIRQRWLHELILVLYKNNFNINTLQYSGIFSFLESWKFPKYVQNFMASVETINVPNPVYNDDISYDQNDLQDNFSSYTYDDLLEGVPNDLEKYVTKNVIDSYKSPNDGIVLSIAGVEAEPDANAIIDILENYLQYKNFIETQENVIIHDNKVEMLKQVILFLREKGYGPSIIANLIQKLYTAVYSTEGKGCQTHNTNFAKNMYDVILPVLRRSGGQ